MLVEGHVSRRRGFCRSYQVAEFFRKGNFNSIFYRLGGGTYVVPYRPRLQIFIHLGGYVFGLGEPYFIALVAE